MVINFIYVGLDVDDTPCHGSALNKHTGEVITFQCRSTLAGLLKQLAKLASAFPDSYLSLCYEASYIGYPRLSKPRWEAREEIRKQGHAKRLRLI